VTFLNGGVKNDFLCGTIGARKNKPSGNAMPDGLSQKKSKS
jgi:hypothetical protein